MIHPFLVVSHAPCLHGIGRNASQVSIISNCLVSLPQRHVKSQTLEGMYLLIEQRREDMLRRTINGDSSKHGVPCVHERFKLFLLGTLGESITRQSHELDDFESGVTSNTRAKMFTQHPQDLATHKSFGQGVHALCLHSNLGF